MSQVVGGPVDSIHHYRPLDQRGVINLAVVDTKHHKIAQPLAVMSGTEANKCSAQVSGDLAPSIMLNRVLPVRAGATKQAMMRGLLEPTG